MHCIKDTQRILQLHRVEPYDLPFLKPLKVGPETWGSRRGWVLHFYEAQSNRFYQGEAAPLPQSFGPSTWQACNEFLTQYAGQSNSQARWLSLMHKLPVMQSALLMALYNPIPPLLFPEKNRQSALLRASDPLLHEAISRKIAEGYTTFKLKVSGTSDHLRRALDPLLEQLPANGKIRLDPNQELDRPQLTSWLKYLENLPIEFIEEPLPSHDKALFSIANDNPIPLALDEQVHSWENLLILNQKGWPGLFIVRPPILGDPLCLFKNHAITLASLKEKFVYASSFEAFHGVNWLLHFYYQFPNERAIGLDPLSSFKR